MSTHSDRVGRVDRESKVEKEACEYAERRGWMVVKLMMCSIDSMPDRMFLRKGVVIFIEFKRPGKEATVKQAKRHRDIQAKGIKTYVCDDLDEAKEILR